MVECSNHHNEVTNCSKAERNGHAHQRIPVCHIAGSMWRFGFNVPTNYNDMSNYCGGKENQWTVQRGRCGVCGDPFQGRRSDLYR